MDSALPPWAKKRIQHDANEVPPSREGNKDNDTKTRSIRNDKKKGGSSSVHATPPPFGANRGDGVAGSRNGGNAPVPSWAKAGGEDPPRLPEQSAAPPSFLRRKKGVPSAQSLLGSKMASGHGDGAPKPRIDKERLKFAIVSKVKAYYDYLTGTIGRKVGTSMAYSCPFHKDKSPSFTVSMLHGGYKCHSCQATGDVFGAWMMVNKVEFVDAMRQIAEWVGDPSNMPAASASAALRNNSAMCITDRLVLKDLERSQHRLLDNKRVMNHLRGHYGITAESVERFRLGWDSRSSRLWIPVYNKGKLVNIRKHDVMRNHCVWVSGEGAKENWSVTSKKPDPIDGWKPYYGFDLCRKSVPRKLGSKVVGVKGFNSVTLYPSATLGVKNGSLDEILDEKTASWIVITGGELKAIYLNQEGVPAVTFTGGEGSFTVNWLKKFKGMDVEVCMDADPAGVTAAERIAKALVQYARRVRIVNLPNGDVNDYYREYGFNFSGWNELPRKRVKDESHRHGTKIKFADLHNPKYTDVEVEFRALVAGSGDTPFFVPNEVHAICKKGRIEPIQACKKCRLAELGYEQKLKIPSEDLIEIRNKGPRKQKKMIQEFTLGIPKTGGNICGHADIKYSNMRIAEIGLVKDVDTIEDWDEESQGNWFVHKVYFVDDADVPENEPVNCHGKIIADPDNSHATMVLRKMKPVRRTFESMSVSKETTAVLSKVDGGNHSVEAVVDRLGWYTSEFEQRICHIYEQRELIIGSLLLWFMPLRFKLNGKVNEKVSAEALLIGDTRAGKTSVGRSLLRHFKAGRFVQCEGATFAGLVGGSGEHGSKKFFTWGVLPSQDGGFVLMDEIDDIVRNGVFGQLTSIRSDGVASRTIAGGVRQCQSRLRMLMASNPLGNRRMRSYSSTMYAINELIKTPQDVARYEYAIGVYRPDDPEIYNVVPDTSPSLYPSGAGAEHVRWAWRQKPVISDSVSKIIMQQSTTLSNEFRDLVLLTSSEARWKVARMACAVAALCSDDLSTGVVVNAHHVVVAADFFRLIYGSKEFAYNKYVDNERVGSPALDSYMVKLGTSAIKFMNENDSFNLDMIDTIVEGCSTRRELFRILTMDNKAIKKHRGGYIKTQGFKDYLGELVVRVAS